MEKVAVITGASSGIGRALSICLAENYRLFLCGRNKEELQITLTKINQEPGRHELIELDLSDSNSIQRAAEFILIKTDTIDLLFNNAGLSQRSLAIETSKTTEQLLFKTNYFGPVEFTKCLLMALRKGGGGKIAISSSIVGKFGYPLRSTYSAAKHALHGYFESLYLEEAKNGIQVQFFVIGRVQTNVSQNALDSKGKAYSQMDKGQALGLPVARCAEQMVSALKSNKKEVKIGGKELLMLYFKKNLPFLFYKIATKESNHV